MDGLFNLSRDCDDNAGYGFERSDHLSCSSSPVAMNGNGRNDPIPDVVAATSCCSSTSFADSSSRMDGNDENDVDDALTESYVQASFAERTALEMQEWIDFWNHFATAVSATEEEEQEDETDQNLRREDELPLPATTPTKRFSAIMADSPQNSLAWDDDDDEMDADGNSSGMNRTRMVEGDSIPDADVRNDFCVQLFSSWREEAPVEDDDDSLPMHCVSTVPSSNRRNRRYGNDVDIVEAPAYHVEDGPGSPVSPSSVPSIASSSTLERPIYSLLDYCSAHPDDTSVSAVTVLSACKDSSERSAEDLHMQARAQKDAVDSVCHRIQWMERCLQSTRMGLDETSSEGNDDLLLSMSLDTFPRDDHPSLIRRQKALRQVCLALVQRITYFIRHLWAEMVSWDTFVCNSLWLYCNITLRDQLLLALAIFSFTLCLWIHRHFCKRVETRSSQQYTRWHEIKGQFHGHGFVGRIRNFRQEAACFAYAFSALQGTQAFHTYPPSIPPYSQIRVHTNRKLIPLTSLSEDLSFLSDQETGRYKAVKDGIGIYVPEESDLQEVSEFVVKAFGADAINLSQDFNAVEQFLLQPVAGAFNEFSALAAYTEVMTGMNQRLKSRLEHPSLSPPRLEGLKSVQEQAREASRASLLLILAESIGQGIQQHKILASVELRLELTDGKIPFSMPWLDRAERQVAGLVGWSSSSRQLHSAELQPYLSSLCVAEEFRKNGFGRALVHYCEDVARFCWGCNRLYLHVDPDNQPALNLYVSEGYREVKGIRWNPFWAGPASNIGYFVKELT